MIDKIPCVQITKAIQKEISEQIDKLIKKNAFSISSNNYEFRNIRHFFNKKGLRI